MQPLRHLAILLFASVVACSVTGAAEHQIDFQRDVRPILSDACFHCHGPDEHSREADLRLDQLPAASILGDASESELIRRIASTDPDEVMPPPESGKKLTDKQAATLRQWIASGAEWDEHWAFERPRKHTPTHTADSHPWVRQPFDSFVLERLRSAGLSPTSAANRSTLIRRLAFDLTGLPPKWSEVQDFINDDSPDAYERVVDRLLQSKHFGERMAMDWLDAARYADTDGYQADSTRTNWPWRDWVVRTFNENKPFDEFTVEQFAGDLLPDAKPDQIIATCFHRNHMTNGEGGRDPEESRVDYVIDRVNTMGTVWLGLTLGCTQCHSHKYDPISHAEYYQLNAFFNSIDEDGRAGGGAEPFYSYSTDEHTQLVHEGLQNSELWLKKKQGELAAVEAIAMQGFDRWLEQKTKDLNSEFRSWVRPRATAMKATHGAQLSQDAQSQIVVAGPNARHEDYHLDFQPNLRRISGMRLVVLPHTVGEAISLSEDGHFILTNMKVNVANRDSNQVREVTIDSAVADYEKEKTGRSYGPVKTVLDDDPRSGWTSLGTDPTQRRIAVFGFESPLELASNEYVTIEFRHRSLAGYVSMRRFTVEFTDELGPTLRALNSTPLEKLATQIFDKLDNATQDDLREQFLIDRREVTTAREQADRAKGRYASYRKAAKPVKVMVLKDRDKTRTTHILERGVWDKKGDEVSTGVLSVLHKLEAGHQRVVDVEASADAEAEDRKPTRLDLASWLIAKDNPLTARVTVNRFWQMLFGDGLVRTPGDFGTQGEPPTHPHVLDWLAVEFQESNWNVKHIIKRMVMSATYRQNSNWSEELLKRDPENRLLARSSRYRLPSWMIRDAALQASGQLDDRLGGPPVYPHQPPGAWADATMGRFHYKPSVGGDLYRRTLYTFWRRSVAPTGLFDASKRRNCEVRQVRTNTPLHALNLLNDETYVEAARALATTTLQAVGRKRTIEGTSKIKLQQETLRRLFQSVILRQATDQELTILQQQLANVRREFAQDPRSARTLLEIGQAPYPKNLNVTELAAYTTLASTILNLDEAMTRE